MNDQNQNPEQNLPSVPAPDTTVTDIWAAMREADKQGILERNLRVFAINRKEPMTGMILGGFLSPVASALYIGEIATALMFLLFWGFAMLLMFLVLGAINPIFALVMVGVTGAIKGRNMVENYNKKLRAELGLKEE